MKWLQRLRHPFRSTTTDPLAPARELVNREYHRHVKRLHKRFDAEEVLLSGSETVRLLAACSRMLQIAGTDDHRRECGDCLTGVIDMLTDGSSMIPDRCPWQKQRLQQLSRRLRRLREQGGLGQSSHHTRLVRWTTGAIFQLYWDIFPPEKMYVVAGRNVASTIVLEAAYGVTGESHSGYVRADPARMANALMSIERSGGFLAAWIHSHPGRGAIATMPSAIDRRQHTEWLKDYSPDLLGAILVEDGYVRFWGTALENGDTSLLVTGSGLQREATHDHLYRLELY